MNHRDIVLATGCSEKGLTDHWNGLLQIQDKYDINTPYRVAGFLSNAIHETGGFRFFKENLNYSAKGLLAVFPSRFTPELAKQMERKPELIANHIYGGRYGNTNIGDGWKYIGRGIFQLTFKENYLDLELHTGIPCVGNPDILLSNPYAMLSAGYYWNKKDLNKYADKQDITMMCKRINGGTNGLQERTELYHKILSVL